LRVKIERPEVAAMDTSQVVSIVEGFLMRMTGVSIVVLILHRKLRNMTKAIEEKKFYCLPYAFEAETRIAGKLTELMVEQTSDWQGVKASTEGLLFKQPEAIENAVRNSVSILTGNPGTGKTHTIKRILDTFPSHKTLLAAPTGKAAKRMEEMTGLEAKTIHRLLEYQQGCFMRDETNPLDVDVVIIDETSMVDIFLFDSLLAAIEPGSKLVLVGDVDQLPSVGPGNVLRDLIDSRKVPYVHLDTILRQEKSSGIVMNAFAVNRGEMISKQDENKEDFPDFKWITVPDDELEKSLALIKKLVTEWIPAEFKYDPTKDIQVLAPGKNAAVGVKRLNAELRELLNPQKKHRPSLYGFYEGDKVMQMKNNYKLDKFNGDVGVVTRIDNVVKEIGVEFGTKDRSDYTWYEMKDAKDLSLAYAFTIHKSQGSEFKAVVVPIHTCHYMLLQRNLLYTAITRAQELVVIVGSAKALKIAAKRNLVESRSTMLQTLLEAHGS
jgi:exodeoxyribonuclease V alpha subunit